MQPRWIEADYARLNGFSTLESAILRARGIDTPAEAERFLGVEQTEHDPFLLRGMREAIQALDAVRESGEKVVVYGDYDADGTTATALLFTALSHHGYDASWYIPHRFEEGYGLNLEAVEGLHREGVRTLVSVDCGIRSLEVVAAARALGMRTIITDHHLPGAELPPAEAIINPHQENDEYPFPGLAGVGLAYKLAQALDDHFGGSISADLADLVAVGTVADLAPLREENRALVALGLRKLNMDPRPGLRALAEHSGVSAGSLTTASIGFGLGPRINAAGRLDHAAVAVELLLADSPPEAWEGAARLDELNRERRQLTARDMERALEVLDEDPPSDGAVLVVHDEFHEGVVGLVASRLTDQFYLPSLVGVRHQGEIVGSARSIPEFHITSALEACSKHLLRFGGHAMAAGFSTSKEELPELRVCIERQAQAAFGDARPEPSLRIDARVGFQEVGPEILSFIDRLEPCGQENPYPVFASSPVNVLAKRTVGADKRHLKLTLGQSGAVFDAIAFGMGDLENELPGQVDVAYRLERNEFRGVVSLQLNVQDIRAA